LAFVLALPALAGALAAHTASDLVSTLHAVEAPSAAVAAFDPKTLGLAVLSLAGPFGVLAAVLAATVTFFETRFAWSFGRLGERPEGGGRPFFVPFVARAAAGFVGLVVALGVLVASSRAVAHTSFGRPAGMPARAARAPTLALRALAGVAVAGAFGTALAAAAARAARLRMTFREVEDERRAGEGDPEVKAARKRVAETVFSEVPLRGLPRATTACLEGHGVAVLVSWNKESESAPRVLRKLHGSEALRLAREAAREDLAVHHAPDLAADVAARVAVGAFIPEAHYDEIATVFASIRG